MDNKLRAQEADGAKWIWVACELSLIKQERDHRQGDKSEDGEKWQNHTYNLKVEPMEFADMSEGRETKMNGPWNRDTCDWDEESWTAGSFGEVRRTSSVLFIEPPKSPKRQVQTHIKLVTYSLAQGN